MFLFLVALVSLAALALWRGRQGVGIWAAGCVAIGVAVYFSQPIKDAAESSARDISSAVPSVPALPTFTPPSK